MAACLHVAQRQRLRRCWPSPPFSRKTWNRESWRSTPTPACRPCRKPASGCSGAPEGRRRAGAGGQLIESCVAVAIESDRCRARAPAFKRLRRAGASRLRLARELALALDAPAVAGQRAVGADHAVAGNRQRDVVGGARAPRRAPPPASRCVRRPAHRWRWRQPESRAALHTRRWGGAAHIQRQVQAQRRVFDEAHHLGHPAFGTRRRRRSGA